MNGFALGLGVKRRLRATQLVYVVVNLFFVMKMSNQLISISFSYSETKKNKN